MPKLKTSNATFWVILKHCEPAFFHGKQSFLFIFFKLYGVKKGFLYFLNGNHKFCLEKSRWKKDPQNYARCSSPASDCYSSTENFSNFALL